MVWRKSMWERRTYEGDVLGSMWRIRGSELTDIHRIFNTGSPWNVPAGQGGANIDHLIAKYEKEAFEQNERKHQEIKENRVPREQPLKPFAKRTPAGTDS
jgi:hypothetical protein